MDQVDVDQIVNELRRRVAARRSRGDYPPGLEEQLEAEFAQIMKAVHRHEVNTEELGRRVKSVEHSVAAVRCDPELGSRVPGGAALHSAASTIVRRHTGTLADGVRAMGIDIARSLHEIHHLIDVQKQADERQLDEVIGSVLDRLAILDHLADAVLDLERRVHDIETNQARG